jgi:hypothetical protein
MANVKVQNPNFKLSSNDKGQRYQAKVKVGGLRQEKCQMGDDK